MKYLLLSFLSVLICSCGPNLENLSFEDRTLEILYNSDDYDEKLEELRNLNPTNAQDSITQIVMYSILECSRIVPSSIPKNTFANYDVLNDERLYQIAKSDSLQMSNYLYLLFHSISDSEFKIMPYMYKNFEEDRNFYYSGFQYLDGSEVSFPFESIGPDSTLILIENPLDSLEKNIDSRENRSVQKSDSAGFK